MGKQIRRLAAVTLVLFGALYVNLNVVQILRADDLVNHPNNRRVIIQEYGIERGPILAGDEPIADSVATEGDLKYRRRYEPARFAPHLLGYYSIVFGRDGLERVVNETLTGTPTDLLAQNLAELLGAADQVGNTVRTTIDPRVQRAASEALGDRIGAIVALDPRSGAVLAHVSSPEYDPNRLSSHDPADVRAYWEELRDDPDQPLADRAIARRFAPGSTFKVVVAAAALERGLSPSTAFEDGSSYTPPQTSRPIRNFGGGDCVSGGTITLAEALEVSCNVVFAKLGVELGAEALAEQAERFGFNRRLPYELPVAESVFPSDLDPPATAQSAIGGRDVQATALQMAVVAGAIANDGVVMRPHVVAEVLDPSGRHLRSADAGPWVSGRSSAQAVSERTARQLADLMVEVVEDGTGGRAAIDGVIVGGKTGTADTGRGTPHAWFVGFAGERGRNGRVDPAVAVAVVLPSAGEGATGGRDAAPLARDVLLAALEERP